MQSVDNMIFANTKSIVTVKKNNCTLAKRGSLFILSEADFVMWQYSKFHCRGREGGCKSETLDFLEVMYLLPQYTPRHTEVEIEYIIHQACQCCAGSPVLRLMVDDLDILVYTRSKRRAS